MDIEDPMNIVESELPAARAVRAHIPVDLGTMPVPDLTRFAQSMGKLNVQLTDAFNSMIKAAEQYGTAMAAIVDGFADLAERLELEGEAAAEQGSETSAAAGWSSGFAVPAAAGYEGFPLADELRDLDARLMSGDLGDRDAELDAHGDAAERESDQP